MRVDRETQWPARSLICSDGRADRGRDGRGAWGSHVHSRSWCGVALVAFGAMPTGSAPPAFPSHARWLAVVVLSSLLLYGGLAGDGCSTGAPLNKLGCSLIRRKAIFSSSTQAVTMVVEAEKGGGEAQDPGDWEGAHLRRRLRRSYGAGRGLRAAAVGCRSSKPRRWIFWPKGGLSEHRRLEIDAGSISSSRPSALMGGSAACAWSPPFFLQASSAAGGDMVASWPSQVVFVPGDGELGSERKLILDPIVILYLSLGSFLLKSGACLLFILLWSPCRSFVLPPLCVK